MSDLRPSVTELGEQVEWPDTDATAEARAHVPDGAGRLAELAEWLAATQGRWPPLAPARARLVVLGPVAAPVAATADAVGAGVRRVDVPDDVATAYDAGVATADAEIEAGADLVVLATPDSAAGVAAAHVIISLLTGAEPVALLPRGPDAVDTGAWIVSAERLRDSRRAAAADRGRPDALLSAVGEPMLAAAVGITLRVTARRTPVVLDGTVAVAAALLGLDVSPRAGHWWQVADASPDPAHARAVDELGRIPLVDLGTRRGEGLAGLLSIPLLRAAAALTEDTTT